MDRSNSKLGKHFLAILRRLIGMETALVFDNVSYRYSGSRELALKGVSFSAKKGEFVGIVGPNEAGKSTLCLASNGLIPHSLGGELEGDVLVEGIDIKTKKVAQLAEYAGLVFSDPEAQLSQMTVWEEIAFGPANLGLPKEEIFNRVELILNLLKIEPLRNRSPFSLSGGEQQKVAIASVFAMMPDILVLDEPTSNLDPKGTEEVFETVRELNKQQNITVLMVEHKVELLAKHADRIIFMDQGQILLDGRPGTVFGHVDLIQKRKMNIPQATEVAFILDKEYGLWGDKEYPVTIEELYSYIQKDDISTY